MAVVTTGPVLTAFKSVLAASDKPLSRETEECSASVVRLLEHHHTTAQRPGMLLGKVQSGKTRAFVGAIAIAFDSGFDIAVVLTKTSKPLAAQTMRRLQQDLAPAIQHNRVRVYNAAGKIGPLNQWQQKLKLILVAKKHPKNLDNLSNALLRDHPALVTKKILIIDDEVDFASVGYQRRQGAVEVRRVQSQIDTLRSGLPNAVYLEVTATPYALYLQPADIEEPSSGRPFKPLRPAFTKRVPPHAGYIGGEVYFDQAQTPGSVASYIHVPVPETELTGMRQMGAFNPTTLLTSSAVQSLRRSLITFIVGGVMRGVDHATEEPEEAERLFSYILHLERLRGSHADQQAVAQQLIDQLRTADLSTGPVAAEVQAAYDDLKASRRAAKMNTPTLASLLPRIGPAFASITTAVVNSDTQLEQLLDDSGQLRQESPFNIYIGGQSLDRGVTIANVIGFFYGRDPKVAQQDTTIQHCRMYGNRPEGDVAVTRFYTSPGIYARMARMHEFDSMLWEQLTAREENGESIDDPGDVVFLERDPAGQVSQCAPNKISLTRAQWTRPRGELVPRPFSTVTTDPDPAEVRAVVDQLKTFGKASVPFMMTVQQACDVLDDVCSLIRIDDGWDWDLDALKDAVRHLAATHPDEARRDQVFSIYTLKNTIRKWNDTAHMDPQRAPYSSTTETAVRAVAGLSPSLGFYHNVGNEAAGWSGSPFVWPVLFVPDGVVPTVFANNRRNAPRHRKRN
jgi:hypothetical protein